MAERSLRGLHIVTRGAIKRLIAFFFVLIATLFWAHCAMIKMPGESFRGELPPLTEQQAALSMQLRRDVQNLAGEIGPRSVVLPEKLNQAVAFLEQSLIAAGYAVQRHSYTVMGVQCHNLEVEITGRDRADEIVIVGAHYDSEFDSGTPAANDNASGVAATLALARAFAIERPESVTPADGPQRTLRFVLFVNEEPPFFQTQDMGSMVYAGRCRERGENIVAMISLETIGCYSDEPGSQQYPWPMGLIYPSTGNFIAFVGNYASRDLVRQAIGTFRTHAKFPSEGGALPGGIPGVGWSDHWAFWQHGYPAIMVTDTAPFRYRHYHSSDDTPDKLDYDRMARVVEGVRAVISDLVNPD